ncbi:MULTISPECIES: Gfo/Idh/MocA family protein [unclassified Acidisoma]|jgi:D-apiose dehydrogenase|uniref:Gfo/Idh/MocA family protein n=1 Tax=unclassified Acidisoma TaxID=2634065 RepID=UPI00131B58A7|nr:MULTISPECIES: Gfo/Idh/MocA family oxidoreductase [unclassified Acidisoma]
MSSSTAIANANKSGAPTRIGLIGCGFYAQNHLNAWDDLKHEGGVLVAVCDSDQGRAQAAGDARGVPWFSDAEKMLSALQPDLVDIVTQMNAHRSLVELVARHGIGLIVQKPLAPNWEDCLAMAAATARAKVFAAVHENFRYQPQMTRMKELIDTNTIGKATFARISFRIGFDVYASQPYLLTEPRGAILDVGIHLLDLARFFCGEVVHVLAETQRRNPRVAAEDTATILLRHESTAVTVVECTYESRRLPDTFPETLIEIEGDEGAIHLHAGNRLVITSRGAMTEETVELPSLDWADPRWRASQVAVLETNRHLLRSFRTSRPADTSIADNLNTYALVDASYLAAERGVAVVPKRWVEG